MIQSASLRYYHQHKAQVRAYKRRYGATREGWASVSRQSAKQRSAQFGVPFSITHADVMAAIPADGRCPVFGVELKFGGGGKLQPFSASLDRIRPELGYVPGNLAVISMRANQIKRDATLAELRALYEWASRVAVV